MDLVAPVYYFPVRPFIGELIPAECTALQYNIPGELILSTSNTFMVLAILH